MINNFGYYNENDIDTVNTSSSIFVNSCGHYKSLLVDTKRPTGRRDYQLIYIVSGQGHFTLNGSEKALQEGNIVIYPPDEPQLYRFYTPESPEFYWLHFSGSLADKYVAAFKAYGNYFFQINYRDEYIKLFENIISELQVKRKHYHEISNSYAEELLCLISRNYEEENNGISMSNLELKKVIELMNKKFNEPFSIGDYAKECSMSTCWFIKSFKVHTGMTPQQFIIQLRIRKAKELLANSNYNVSQISFMVGYDNPLYFSRIFKKVVGKSPKEFKKVY